MVRICVSDIIILLCILDIAAALVPNVTNVVDINNELRGVETRRRRRGKKARSTSSSEQARDKRGRDSKSESKESLELSTNELTSSSSEASDKPKSTIERRGWRKWHRKCTPCPEDMAKKWRDYSIEWICGAYQRARRSFKSECMMHYRNCQDGTMFVKIHDHRCANDTGRNQPHGIHFFYDYKVNLEEDSSDSSNSESSDTLSEGSSGSD